MTMVLCTATLDLAPSDLNQVNSGFLAGYRICLRWVLALEKDKQLRRLIVGHKHGCAANLLTMGTNKNFSHWLVAEFVSDTYTCRRVSRDWQMYSFASKQKCSLITKSRGNTSWKTSRKSACILHFILFVLLDWERGWRYFRK